jgi:hypothetical protein
MSVPAPSRRPDHGAVLLSLLAFAFGIVWLGGILVVFRELELVDGEWRYALGDHWGYDIEA